MIPLPVRIVIGSAAVVGVMKNPDAVIDVTQAVFKGMADAEAARQEVKRLRRERVLRRLRLKRA